MTPVPSDPFTPFPPAELARLVGLRYVERGTDPDRDGGVDCYGLVRLALRLRGVELPPTPEEALASAEALGRELAPWQAFRVGDVVDLIGAPGADAHLGVVVSPFELLHATREAGSCVNSLDAWIRARKVRRFLRPRGFA